MSKLKKCLSCENYTLFDNCGKCGKITVDAHYKFVKIRDAPRGDGNFKRGHSSSVGRAIDS